MASKQPLPDFSHSMTDLMASVAVMFLLIAAVFMLKESGLKAQAEKKLENVSTVQRDSLGELVKLVQDLDGMNGLSGAVQRDPQDPFSVTVEFPEREAYFNFNRAELRDNAKESLIKPLAQVVARVCEIDPRFTNSIILEGHTDKVGKLPPNVRLSSERAHSVYFAVRDALIDEEDEETLDCIDSRFTVAGRGYVAPKTYTGKWSDEARKQDPADRRVVLKVRFTSGGEKLAQD